jgi:hypothetical protein
LQPAGVLLFLFFSRRKGGGHGYEDVNGDGTLEMVNVHNSFLYAFESYAGSFSGQRNNRYQGYGPLPAAALARLR